MSVKARKAATRLGVHPRHPEGRRLLQLEDGDAGSDKLRQRARDVLEPHSLVTDVEHDPEVPSQDARGLRDGQPGELASSWCTPAAEYSCSVK